MAATIPLQRGILYGPVQSRRLGRSLGLNILPDEIKVCSMDCRYCQYSWTGLLSQQAKQFAHFLPSRDSVAEAIEKRLKELASVGTPPDTITFSGNGEATLHPDFPGIASDVVAARDAHAPRCRTAILSNSTTVHRKDVRSALILLDDPVLKLDTGREDTFRLLNRPARGVRFEDLMVGLQAVGPRITLQAMFVQGRVDNSTDEEVRDWAKAVAAIKPKSVQIYTLDRGPADHGLQPVPFKRLKAIADALQEQTGVAAMAYD
jgi:wyosine [tRNA(Phe)-imidazoG37] synthetase (radical SAM superfamily)